MSLVGWWGIAAPAATPKPIVERLNALLNEMADDPAIREKLEKVFMLPLKMSADQAVAQLKADLPVWAKIVKDADIKGYLERVGYWMGGAASPRPSVRRP